MAGVPEVGVVAATTGTSVDDTCSHYKKWTAGPKDSFSDSQLLLQEFRLEAALLIQGFDRSHCQRKLQDLCSEKATELSEEVPSHCAVCGEAYNADSESADMCDLCNDHVHH